MNNQILYFLVLVLLFSGCSQLGAQSKSTNKVLYDEIVHLDSVVFTAFNNRDTSTFRKYFAQDLEFYHDKGGLTGYTQTIAFLNSTAKSGTDLKRSLVAGSLEVYLIPNYGAIEIGAHSFCHAENGKQDCGTFRFVHVWKKMGSEWKITRVISYGH